MNGGLIVKFDANHNSRKHRLCCWLAGDAWKSQNDTKTAYTLNTKALHTSCLTFFLAIFLVYVRTRSVA